MYLTLVKLKNPGTEPCIPGFLWVAISLINPACIGKAAESV
jgi:hypothetical protein